MQFLLIAGAVALFGFYYKDDLSRLYTKLSDGPGGKGNVPSPPEEVRQAALIELMDLRDEMHAAGSHDVCDDLTTAMHKLIQPLHKVENHGG